MKNRIILICMPAILLSGCTLFHKTTKDKSINLVDSTNIKTYKNVSVDTGTTVIEQRIDTVVRTGKIHFEKYFPLKPGLSFPGFASALNSLDTAMLGLNLSYDSLHHAIKVTGDKRPEAIPVFLQTKTTIKNGKTSASEASDQVAVKKKNEVLKRTSVPDYSWYWWVICFIICFCFGFFVKVRLNL